MQGGGGSGIIQRNIAINEIFQRNGVKFAFKRPRCSQPYNARKTMLCTRAFFGYFFLTAMGQLNSAFHDSDNIADAGFTRAVSKHMTACGSAYAGNKPGLFEGF